MFFLYFVLLTHTFDALNKALYYSKLLLADLPSKRMIHGSVTERKSGPLTECSPRNILTLACLTEGFSP